MNTRLPTAVIEALEKRINKTLRRMPPGASGVDALRRATLGSPARLEAVNYMFRWSADHKNEEVSDEEVIEELCGGVFMHTAFARLAKSQVKIVDAEWTPQINMMVILCDCGVRFRHRADRWHVRCPQCGRRDHLRELRNRIQPGDLDV